MVVAAAGVIEKRVAYSVFRVFYRSHYVAHLLVGQAEVVENATEIPHALLSTVVLVQGTVARRLVGVEISFGKEARHAERVVEYSAW